MAKLEDLAERVDRLVLRHQELKRTSALIEQQLVAVSAERDSLKSRLAAARARIDALLERIPTDAADKPSDKAAHPVGAGIGVDKGNAT
jgi:cell division protein ZapB